MFQHLFEHLLKISSCSINPNPFQSNTILQLDHCRGTAQYHIVSLSGQVLEYGRITDQSVIVGEGLKPRLYLLYVHTTKGILEVEKLVEVE
ncbi:MAG: T9SS type A sorting domain-containing protein [Bacteroidota bacterium]